MRRLLTCLLLLTASLTAGATLAPAPARADTTSPSYAPLDRPGPRLTVPAATLDAALQCHGDPKAGPRPVLLNPATSVTPEENYSWNWAKVFTKQRRYHCTVTMPYHTFGDIQVAGEYLVNAIRRMYARTGRRIAILGHSQGGMSGRWALRFWPDTRAKVAEVIGMAPSNHGTTVLAGCITGLTTCVPAVWQQRAGSAFMKALNSRAETFAGIDYTNVYTMLDEVVVPPPSSGLTTGAGRIVNVRVQDVCPLDPYEHVMTGTVSPATYAIVMDALTHDGPARASRVDRKWCSQLYMPGIDPADVAGFAPILTALPNLLLTVVPSVTLSGAPLLKKEPALRCYVYAAGC
ncbi:pimeloyl-ACP methyl ester carboxylesterase [Nocardioides aromaticivorans]|uniref:Pimeloyl-ACP methyl ester carboxylesterase n=1 Tax=Nocardioides aromaticivorans TaxID=200618 RepID=A0A7Z0CLW3_9ACTN|nr:lipase [Nocardioides aromaticivorans]NYI43200.1 pimeloyl-ACP methyl ester carboxylesterase [Nocardioides aromaticivorans]